MACITYITASTIQPAYLYSLLNITSHLSLCVHPTQLFVPHVRTCFGSHSFAIAAIIIWNSIPLAICSNVSTHSFQRQLNTYVYISWYSHLSSLLNTLYACQPAPQIWQDVCWQCALYKFTYEEVGIVFDQYLSGSLKETTFKKRMIKTAPW